LLHEIKAKVLEPLVKNSPNLPQNIVEILIGYHNGHGPHDFDRKNPETALARRILHRFLLENREKMTLYEFFSLLEQDYEWELLSVSVALLLVAKVHRLSNGLPDDTTLLIYVGLDEFNQIGSACQCNKFPTSDSHFHLRHIVEAIGNVYIEPPSGTSHLLHGRNLSEAFGHDFEPIWISIR